MPQDRSNFDRTSYGKRLLIKWNVFVMFTQKVTCWTAMKLIVKYRYLTGASCALAGTQTLFPYKGTQVSTFITQINTSSAVAEMGDRLATIDMS